MRNLLVVFLIALFITVPKPCAEGSFAAMASNLQESCSPSQTEDPPFYISDEFKQGDRLWENFRNIEDHNEKIGFIPRGTIVYADPELSEAHYSPDHRVPVRVVQVFDDTRAEIKRATGPATKLKPTSITPNGLPLVVKGQEGFLDRRAMQPAGKYTFFVKKDSPLYKGMGSNPDLINLPLTLKIERGKYQGHRCCLSKGPSDEEPLCHFKYSFQSLVPEGQIPQTFDIEIHSCGFMESVVPVQSFENIGLGTDRYDSNQNELGLSVNNILQNMEERYPGFGIGTGWNGEANGREIQFNGLRFLSEHRPASDMRRTYRPYMMRIPIDHETKEGPFNSVHYNPDDSSDNDTFLRPVPMCTFMEALKKFEQRCGSGISCRVQFGNFYHNPAWNVHETHGSGYCLDLRPMRTDPRNVNDGLKVGWGNYDREKTQLLVNTLRDAGATDIILEDRKMEGVRRLGNSTHKNHLHVCFDPENSKVRNTCFNGMD